MGPNQGYNIHANSKHYFPKDAEFLTNDAMSKPGAKFTSNRNAVLIKDEKQPAVDPYLEDVEQSHAAAQELEALREQRNARDDSGRLESALHQLLAARPQSVCGEQFRTVL